MKESQEELEMKAYFKMAEENGLEILEVKNSDLKENKVKNFINPIPKKINLDTTNQIQENKVKVEQIEQEYISPVASIKSIPNNKRVVCPTIMVDPKSLPSKGLFYPDNVKIYYKTYLAIEIEQISEQIDLLSIADIFQYMLDGIQTIGISKEDLTFDDFHFISYERKLASLGDHKISYKEICSECGKEHILNKDFDSSEGNSYTYIDLPDNMKPYSYDFDFYYEDDNGEKYKDTRTLTFTPLTIGNYIKIYKENLHNYPYSFSIFQCINDDPIQLINNEFNVNVLSYNHSEKLQEIEKMFYHNLKDLQQTCNAKLQDIEGNFILDENNKPIRCKNKMIFKPERSFELVLPFR